MSAICYIHVVEYPVTMNILKKFFSNSIGHKWYDGSVNKDVAWEEARDTIKSAKGIALGGVSFMKAASHGIDRFLPAPIKHISGLVEDGVTVVDDKFIVAVRYAMTLPNYTTYKLEDVETIVIALSQHIGKRMFMVAW